MNKLSLLCLLPILSAGCIGKIKEYDVCVYGGTPGGITAAISAAREGASVILLEQTRHVGGLTTSGLNRDECNHLDRQTLGGLCEQFIEEAVKRSKGRWTEGNSRTWQSGIAERVFLEMLKKAGVEVRYEQLLDQVGKDGARITELRVQGGEIYRAKVFIDATYEGDLMAKAGVSYSVGRESAEQYGESIAGVRYLDDKVAISPFDDEGNLLFGVMPGKPPVAGSASKVPICYNVRLNLTTDEANRVPIEKPSSYDPMQHELLARALEAGLLKDLKSIIGLYPMGESSKRELNNRQFSIVSMSIPGAQTSWAEASFKEREAIHQKYRDYTHGMLWFLKTNPRVPEPIRDEMATYGFCKDEWADNDHWPHYLYVRAARRLQGEIILTQADVIEDVDKEDVIHVGSHFIDCHHAARYVSDSGHIINEGRIWKVGTRFDIPYRAITPKAGECSNLLVPVCASASHVAFCTIRLEPTWMHLGEAAGIAAAMASKSGESVQAVDVKSLQARLLELGIPLEHPVGPMAYEKKRGKPKTFSPDDVVKEFFASADKNGDGMASRSEWNAARPTWKWLFDHMDKDKNGQLDRAEYKAWQTYKKDHPDWHKSLRDSLKQGSVKQPNFIVILTDDQGWGTTSVVYDPKVPDSKSDFHRTPNIERLAAAGMRFTQGYSAHPNCSPSRAALLTGRSPAALHFTDICNRNTGGLYVGNRLLPPQHIKALPEEEQTIPELLKATHPEYIAAHFGKWHLNGGGPEAHGFDAGDGSTSNAQGGKKNNLPNDPKRCYSITKRAIDWMKKQSAVEKPFYLQVSHYATHLPLQARPETLSRFEAAPSGTRHDNVPFAAMIADMDESIGQLLDALAASGVADNTYVIFTADNGTFPIESPGNINGPLRGSKATIWEAGVRVPFIVTGPGIESNSISRQPAIGYDILPTICELAGIETWPEAVEGGSLIPALHQKGDISRSRDALYFHWPHYQHGKKSKPDSTIIIGDYKLHYWWETGDIQLFNLSKDLAETTDLAKSHPEKAASLKKELFSYLEDIDAQLPAVNDDYDPATDPARPKGKNRKKKK